ncbi:MAG: hypothetical protein A2W82_05445 [Sulfurimonas sp. RIFCSPLOWO2_12_36_12]|uniref:helix-turn-helix domain-containing protein n=1 Tax=Sulfurimonas sp. RIFCSPLOWO2_12_36_12 TaxID=1802253 RepID=UPI0008BE4B1F|nr:helix-turn-helix domain-containing protein [Sulfurimonas sp. RIFCSPLOWO2_12_36_12]OHD99629.1 MAG: hypothetical protein A3J26_07895 [Sulfurimonas sp. RIFCSPLOWO2_02_FULL_36_28]OHE01374.1 MAG: hypothetical protein A2W82_05445 [Sulfurimonas sp. RIFCSPLOWO2_12_36_12]
MSEKLLNIDDVTKGAMAVLISQVLPKEEEDLTVAQTAQYLNMSVESLHLMRLNRKGPSCHKDGNRVLYKLSSVKAFMQANSINKKQKQKIGA